MLECNNQQLNQFLTCRLVDSKNGGLRPSKLTHIRYCNVAGTRIGGEDFRLDAVRISNIIQFDELHTIFIHFSSNVVWFSLSVVSST